MKIMFMTGSSTRTGAREIGLVERSGIGDRAIGCREPRLTDVGTCVENNDDLRQSVEGRTMGSGEDVRERLDCKPCCTSSTSPFEARLRLVVLTNEFELVNGGDALSPL